MHASNWKFLWLYCFQNIGLTDRQADGQTDRVKHFICRPLEGSYFLLCSNILCRETEKYVYGMRQTDRQTDKISEKISKYHK